MEQRPQILGRWGTHPEVQERTLRILLELRQLAEGLGVWRTVRSHWVGHRQECLHCTGEGRGGKIGRWGGSQPCISPGRTTVRMFACDPEGLALYGAFRRRFKWVPRHLTGSVRWHWSEHNFTSNLWTYGMPHHNRHYYHYYHYYYYYCHYS